MPSRSLARRVRDMLEQIAETQQFVEGMSFTEFCEDRRTLKAVLYGLAVIGEAAASLLPEVQTTYPQIPWAQIRGMRNVTIHEYFQVELEIVWETVQTDLPRLAKALQQILDEL
ncbi:MAG: DUF86 domain-containing protein [Cyanobacteriota bacterium]|nr:DUF86 domain-containing protein [Cyanobacteriota bacterium]